MMKGNWHRHLSHLLPAKEQEQESLFRRPDIRGQSSQLNLKTFTQTFSSNDCSGVQL